MKKIELIIRPEKLEPLKKILSKNEYSGLTVMSAMGCGHQKGYSEEFKKLGMEINLLPKLYVMTVILDEDLDDILTEICEKLFLSLHCTYSQVSSPAERIADSCQGRECIPAN